MRLFLVRHGQTASNLGRLLDTARPGAALDGTGLDQAERLVARFAGIDVDAIYASDLTRTQQTAAPLAAARGLDVGVLGGLREIPAGDVEMSEVWQPYVSMLIAWAQGDLSGGRPGGETGEEFFARYDGAIASIASAGHAAAVAVSHGGALRMWLGNRVSGVDTEALWRRPLGNTAVIVLEGDLDLGWTIVDWNPGEDVDSLPA